MNICAGRASELTDYFGLPKTTVKESRENGLGTIVDERCSRTSLDQFKIRYATRIKPFVDTASAVGLGLVNKELLRAANAGRYP